MPRHTDERQLMAPVRSWAGEAERRGTAPVSRRVGRPAQREAGVAARSPGAAGRGGRSARAAAPRRRRVPAGRSRRGSVARTAAALQSVYRTSSAVGSSSGRSSAARRSAVRMSNESWSTTSSWATTTSRRALRSSRAHRVRPGGGGRAGGRRRGDGPCSRARGTSTRSVHPGAARAARRGMPPPSRVSIRAEQRVGPGQGAQGASTAAGLERLGRVQGPYEVRSRRVVSARRTRSSWGRGGSGTAGPPRAVSRSATRPAGKTSGVVPPRPARRWAAADVQQVVVGSQPLQAVAQVPPPAVRVAAWSRAARPGPRPVVPGPRGPGVSCWDCWPGRRPRSSTHRCSARRWHGRGSSASGRGPHPSHAHAAKRFRPAQQGSGGGAARPIPPAPLERSPIGPQPKDRAGTEIHG